MKLLIVESPAKGKTIEKYLGADYHVLSSYGHIRDLPEKKLGVDTEHNFEPEYVIPAKSERTIATLKGAIKDAEIIYLATDFDREGEAIGWHLAEALKIKEPKRITFTEITKDALQEAVKNPRDLDMNLVDAQQARRILDRLVGYKLSPFLWKKIFRGLSAGRVQSVAVRMIVEKEREIENFKPEIYFVLGADLKKKTSDEQFYAQLATKIEDEKEAKNVSADLEKAKFNVKSIEKNEIKKYPFPPYTTSTLQQDASYKLYFSAKKTMKLAQDLYEAGVITYMRTDSVNLSGLAINSCRKYLKENLGENYLPPYPRKFKTKTMGAQEAHEAIRPTYISNEKLEILNSKFGEDHQKLYQLIRNRMLACQMKEAELEEVNLLVAAKNEKEYELTSRAQKIKFDGFLKVYPLDIKENELPELKENEELDLLGIKTEQKETQPPKRFSEAALIKALEEKGIGRPSTYAPIISAIESRGYVRLEKRIFYPQETGFLVNDLLVEHFPEIVDYDFTKHLEDDLDQIAEGKEKWTAVLTEFYQPFAKRLAEKEKTVEKKADEATEEKCPKCNKPMVIKFGRFGKFLACSGFPECKTTKQLVKELGIACPDCKTGGVIERKTRKGKIFWGCSNYPKCKWASWNNPNANSTRIDSKPD